MILSSYRSCGYPKLGRRRKARVPIRLVLTPVFELRPGREEIDNQALSDVIQFAKGRLEHLCPSRDVLIEKGNK